jgi:hypothetical protein
MKSYNCFQKISPIGVIGETLKIKQGATSCRFSYSLFIVLLKQKSFLFFGFLLKGNNMQKQKIEILLFFFKL